MCGITGFFQWLGDGKRVESQMEESELVRSGILDRDVVHRLLAAPRAERADHGQAI
jgi:hypothetical protein